MNQRKNNIFTQVPAPHVRRNLFDLSHEVKMSGKFGFLYPILLMDTLPGDNIRDTMNVFLRTAPLLSPVMHRLDVSTHFFFVPNRLLTDHWESFITGGQDGDEAPVLPFVTADGLRFAGGDMSLFTKGSLWDYLGLPVYDGADLATDFSVEQVSALPFRACAKVWNDFYRDPNLDEEMDLDLELQGDVSGWQSLHQHGDIKKYRRAFEKDYFTSALPWAQRGSQVLMPLSVTVDHAQLAATGFVPGFSGDLTHTAGGVLGSSGVGGAIELTGENVETTINDFRRALAVQQWMEANARGGGRYVEQILGHFDVQVPDYRLARSEYLGGGKQPVQISEVLRTAGDNANDEYVGDMSGKGISVGRTNRFSYRCEEHGWIVGFLSVTMRTAYFQGIPKMWSRPTKFDYGWPELANLGEQEILQKELFYTFDDNDDAAQQLLFGYTPRYSEYKFLNDRVAGDFRDNLGFWHLARRFTVRPSLDVAFTTIFENGEGTVALAAASAEEETFRRIFAVQDGTDYLWMQLYHHLTAKRPLPYFGVPRII